MNVGRLIRSAYLLYFSQPAGDRALYRALMSRPVRSIVELGIGFSGRTKRLLEVASWRSDCLPVRYTGIDLFEARPAGSTTLSLKAAFAEFRLPHIRAQLVPGEPHQALRRVANSLASTDLLLISADQDPAALDQAWTWMPRMLSPQSLIFQEYPAPQAGQTMWRPLSLDAIQQLAKAGRASRRAA